MLNQVDWHAFWTAAGVVLTLGSLVIGCFFRLAKQLTSLTERVTIIDNHLSIVSQKVDGVDQRLSKLEGGFEERGRWESRKG